MPCRDREVVVYRLPSRSPSVTTVTCTSADSSNNRGSSDITVPVAHPQVRTSTRSSQPGDHGLSTRASQIWSGWKPLQSRSRHRPGARLRRKIGRFLDVLRHTSHQPRGIDIAADGTIFVSTTSGEVTRYAPASSAVFTVTLSEPSLEPITVSYTTANGTATAGSDYISKSGTLFFAPGETTRTILVRAIDDSTFEPSETFTINLSNAGGGTIADGQSIGTINDTDPLHGDIDHERRG